eukprot:1425773-Prymnesium_polylepis.1
MDASEARVWARVEKALAEALAQRPVAVEDEIIDVVGGVGVGREQRPEVGEGVPATLGRARATLGREKRSMCSEGVQRVHMRRGRAA